MVTLYEYLQQNKTVVHRLTKSGLISAHCTMKMEIYEKHIDNIEKMQVMVSYSVLSEKYNVSKDTIRRAVSVMKTIVQIP